ncbi:universal stress protein [Chloroflexota bacterium]
MVKKIVIPLDGSKVGEAALSYVEKLVANFLPETKVEVTLLQVVPSLPHYMAAGGEDMTNLPIVYTEKEIEQFKEDAAGYLNKVGEALRSKGAIVSIMVGIGQAAEEIIKATDEINADLVAMSTHGRSGFSRWAFGSVTDRVLRGGSRPVLVVRPSKEEQSSLS